MINWSTQQRVYPQWQAGQMSTQGPQIVQAWPTFGQTPVSALPGDDDGDYFYTITNW